MSNVTGPGTAQDRNRFFEQLVDRYQEPVLRMCYYCLCDKTQAEDAAQETFLKLYCTGRWTITGVTAARKPGS